MFICKLINYKYHHHHHRTTHNITSHDACMTTANPSMFGLLIFIFIISFIEQPVQWADNESSRVNLPAILQR